MAKKDLLEMKKLYESQEDSYTRPQPKQTGEYFDAQPDQSGDYFDAESPNVRDVLSQLKQKWNARRSEGDMVREFLTDLEEISNCCNDMRNQ